MTTRIKLEIGSKKFRDETNKIKDSTREIEAGLGGIALKAGVAFAAISAGIGGFVLAASKVEDVTTRFEVLTGSVNIAAKSVKALQDFSARTPFQFESIAKAGAQLISFGVSADDLIPKLESIGDVAAASGTEIGEIALIFGQVSAAGKLTGERLLQFQERAIPIGPALAKTLGIAESAVKDFVSTGKVDFATFEKAFESLSEVGGAAFEGMIKQSQTFSGVASTLKDNISLLAADIGKEFLPAVKAIAIQITNLFQFLRSNPEFVKMAAASLAAAAAITAIITVVALAGLAFIKLKGALFIANIALTKTKIAVIGLAGATGIGLLFVVITELFLNWNTIWPIMQSVFSTFVKNISKISDGLGSLLASIFSFDLDNIKNNLKNVRNIFSGGLEEFKTDLKKRNDAKTKAGDDQAVIDEEQELKALEKAKEKREIKAQEIAEDREIELEADRLFNEEKLLVNEEFEALSTEQQNAFKASRVEALKKDLKTGEGERVKAIQTTLKNKQKANKAILKEQQEFGKAFSAVNQFLNSASVKQSKDVGDELIKLRQSDNKTLKTIGKVAAVREIAQNTASSAVSVFKGFQGLPFGLGIPLGIAAAGVVFAFGAEQIGKVLAAQHGGIVPGVSNGRDEIPSLLEPGELVVPRANFDEVINAVSQQRDSGTDSNQSDSDGPTGQLITVDFASEEASQIIVMQEIEDEALGLSRRQA